MNTRVAILGCMLFVASVATAQESSLQPAIANCAAVSDSLQRLGCYDAIGRALPKMPADTKPAGAEGAGAWKVNVKANPVDDSKTVTLQLVDDDDTAALILRCMRAKPEAYIVWTKFIGSDGTSVLTRLGDGKAETRRWSISTDHKATFYPGDQVALMNQLGAVDKFVAQVTPYGANPVTAVFNVTGLSKAIAPLKGTCNIP